LSVLPGIFAALSPLLMSNIFPPEIRLTRLALSYNLGHTIFGGLAPIIVTGLIGKFGYPALVLAMYFVVVIAFIATLYSIKYTKTVK
jgi:MHS family proline/betaine transporter-like MFS transporter